VLAIVIRGLIDLGLNTKESGMISGKSKAETGLSAQHTPPQVT